MLKAALQAQYDKVLRAQLPDWCQHCDIRHHRDDRVEVVFECGCSTKKVRVKRTKETIVAGVEEHLHKDDHQRWISLKESCDPEGAVEPDPDVKRTQQELLADLQKERAKLKRVRAEKDALQAHPRLG